MSATATKMDAALSCAHRGLAVFPLWSAIPTRDGSGYICACGSAHIQNKNAAKHPHRLAPNGLHDASSDETRVREWWTSAPTANIGVATGPIVALDIDRRHDGFASLGKLEDRVGGLPRTWRVVTGGGGEHYYFRAPQGVALRNSTGKLGPGIDVRGVGGYVVGPGSTHITGRTYEWDVDGHPDEIPLAVLPEKVVEEARGVSGPGIAAPPEEWRAIVSNPVPEGARNATLARLAGHLLFKNIDTHVAHELCHAWNITKCSPPLSAGEVTRTFNSICEREMKRGRKPL